jgi:TIR domain
LYQRDKPLRKSRSPRRDTIVLSHAYEDNQFTCWLALQLARNGYHVWSDLTHLLGGEIFWNNIETLIRQGCVKFIYVLSRNSNRGEGRGFWKELDLADAQSKVNKISDFIIPVSIDDLPSNDYNIYLHTRHVEQFHPCWSDGLETLLAKLEKHKVPRRREFSPKSVTYWWRRWFRNPTQGVEHKPATYLSSWFPIEHLPHKLYIHHCGDSDDEKSFTEINWCRPAIVHGNGIVTFAPASDFISQLEPDHSIGSTEEISVADILDRTVKKSSIDGGQLRKLLSWLLRVVWEQWLVQQPVGIYSLANNAKCAFFLKPPTQDALYAPFIALDGSKSDRALTGYWTRPSKEEGGPRQKHFWHFGVQAHPRLGPEPIYRISTHVIFSDDGTNAWTSAKRMHVSRRRQCKTWYNDTWRDRLLASMTKLAAEGTKSISIPVSSDERVEVSIRPLTFDSPVTFNVISKSATADSEKDRADEEIEDEDDDEPDDEPGQGDEPGEDQR